MSFLARSQPIRIISQATRSPHALRAFTASSTQQKVVPEPLKDVLKTVDRKVSDKLVDAFEVTETVAKKTKEVTGLKNNGFNEQLSAEGGAEKLAASTRGKASELAGRAKGAMYNAEGSAEEVAGRVSGKASELAGKAKGAMYEAEGSAEQMAGQASGKASKMAGQAKGKASELGGDLQSKANEVEGAAKGRSAELQGKSGTAKPGVKGM